MSKPTRAKSTYMNAPAQERHTVAYTGTAESSPHMDGHATLAPGMIIEGRYRIEEQLGEGGMASVYRARQIEIGAPVAIKVLHPWLLAVPGAAEGFLLEARAISRIRHRNIVMVSDFGRIGGRTPFMVMEDLHGEDLFDHISRHGPLPWPRVRAIALQLCEGLTAVHAAGVIHRDVKPENCFLVDHGGDDDFVKLIDFGVAKAIEARAKMETESGLLRVPLQSSGALAGTPDFMAPEEVYERPLDHRVDIYSLGATLFVLLTGHTLFEGESVDDTIMHHALTPPPAPSSLDPMIPPAVDALILRALAKDPEDRYADMYAFARAIEAVPGRPERDHGERTVIHAVMDEPTFGSSIAAFGSSISLLRRKRRPKAAFVTAAAALAVATLTLAHATLEENAGLAWSRDATPPALVAQLSVPAALEHYAKATAASPENPTPAPTDRAPESMYSMTSSSLRFDAQEPAVEAAPPEEVPVPEVAEAPATETAFEAPPPKTTKRTRQVAKPKRTSGRDLPTLGTTTAKPKPRAHDVTPFLVVHGIDDAPDTHATPARRSETSESPAPADTQARRASPLKNPYAGS